MYFQTFRQMKKTLGQMDKWLESTIAFATEKKFDPNVLVSYRLAPDQFPFSKQIQTACDTAKIAAGRLTGKEMKAQEDKEQTIEDLRARIHATVAILDGLTEKDFEGAATRTISQPRWEGKTMTGADYFLEHAVPNFYFHTMTAYAILRHNGVPIGKRDYLGALSLHAPK